MLRYDRLVVSSLIAVDEYRELEKAVDDLLLAANLRKAENEVTFTA